MKRQPFVFAITQADLVKIYGDQRPLRNLLKQLQGSHDTEERLGLILRFDESNWLQWSSPILLDASANAHTMPASG